MIRFNRIITILVVAGMVCIAGSGAALAGKKKKMKENSSPDLPVLEWLVLGPVPEPFPAFHEEKKGTFAAKEMLAGDRFPSGPVRPSAGDSASWQGETTLTWKKVQAGDDGRIRLDRNEGWDGPAEAWLAVYLESDRWRSVKMKVSGNQAMKFYLDGKSLADGGYGKNGENGKNGKKSDDSKKDNDLPSIESELKLTPGKHLVLVRTLFDPEREAWEIGAELLAATKDDDDGEEAGGSTVEMPRLSLDPARNITIGDILDSPSPSSVRVSPDGKLVAYTVRQGIHGTDKSESWIEIRTLPDGKLVRKLRGGESKSRLNWAPDGHRLSYVSRRADDKTSSLWVHDLDSGEVSPILEQVKEFGGYAWAPDGRSVAYWITEKPEKDKSGVKRLEGLQDRQPSNRNRSYLYLVTVPDGIRRRLTAGKESTGFGSFSPDGKKMLFTRGFEDLSQPNFSRSDLYELDLRTLEVEKLRSFGWLQGASYSPDGSRILLSGGPSMFGQSGVNVPEGVTPNTYDTQLYIWDPADQNGSKVVAVTRDFDPAVSGVQWSRADGHIYIRAEEGEYARLYRYTVKDGSFTEIELPFELTSGLAYARAARVAVAIGSSSWTPPSLAVVDLSNDQAHTLDQPAQDWFTDVRFGDLEDFTITAANGKTISGRVYLPPGYDASKKYPALVYYYGGTSPTGRSFGGRYPKEWWASNGYVIYVPQPSGATGFGQEFSAAHVNDWGEVTAAEIIEGTEKFLKAYPAVDPKRVGCLGASYGGFLTLSILTKTDMFAAAVSHAGISALSSYWGEGYWGYSYSSVATAGSYPWNRKDLYVENSPLFSVDKVTTPVLLTHGDQDPNVPPGESAQFYTALKILGKEVEYLSIAGQEHWIMDHAKRLQWSGSIVAWFDRWLKDQPEWWESMYPPLESD